MTEIIPFTTSISLTRTLSEGQTLIAKSDMPASGPWNKMVKMVTVNKADSTKMWYGQGVTVQIDMPAGEYDITVTADEGTAGRVEML